MKSVRLYMCTLLVVLPISVAIAAGTETPSKPKVFVSILPQKYFVERIGGDRVDVNVLVGPGQSPHTYEPTPRQLANLTGARLLFRIGLPFEDILMPKIESAFKSLKVVDTRRGVKLRFMEEHEGDHEAEEAHGHASDKDKHSGEDTHAGEVRHDPEDEHGHEAGSPDPHTWLDPVQAKIQARTICDSLSEIDPVAAPTYRANLKSLQEDLDRLNVQISSALAPIKGKQIFVFHPAYGYFTDRYGLKQVAVEMGGKEPSAQQLARLVEKAKRDGVRVIFVQPQFSTKYAATLAKEIGGAVVSLDPLAPDYFKNLQDMAAKVQSALSAGGK